jgi:uncharacterized membrane protein YccC
MPKIVNKKHEQFAIGLADGKPAKTAYAEAFGCTSSTASANASRLLAHEVHGLAIKVRVGELRQLRQKQEDLAVEKAIEKVAISRAWVLQELRENAERAKKRGQGAVVNRALELIGREIGMFSDQPEKKIGLDDLSLETLEALAAELESDPEVIAGMAEQSTLALPPPRQQ